MISAREMKIKRPTLRERLADSIDQNDRASKSIIALIAEMESLCMRFQRCLVRHGDVPNEEQAKDACRTAYALIYKVRRGQ